MEFYEKELFHIYNRGNNKQQIFFIPENYIYFLEKARRFILPHCDILAWCLMPNHFHFLIKADKRTIQTITIGKQQRNVLSEGVRNLLQTYTKAINKQNKTTGSLFQQNTKAKSVSIGPETYGKFCMHYIHQNLLKANMVEKMEEWPYSSFQDYCGFRKGTLSNKEIAFRLFGLTEATFYDDSYKSLNDEDLENIF
jgi:REP element-mobilizing transposase RayT